MVTFFNRCAHNEVTGYQWMRQFNKNSAALAYVCITDWYYLFKSVSWSVPGFLHHDCQPHRVTSGRITSSQLLHTKLKRESLSVSDCRSEGLGFKAHQSCDTSQPWPASTQSWECYGPSGKAGATQLSFIHFTNASLRVLLLIIWPTLQVPQFPGLVNPGIIMTGSMVCGPVK